MNQYILLVKKAWSNYYSNEMLWQSYSLPADQYYLHLTIILGTLYY